MRVVLDTNILLVSISSKSPYHWIFLNLINGNYELAVTTDVLLKYSEIIERHMGTKVSESVLGVLENLSNIILITSWFRFDLIKKDRDDNKFVDCAIASNADYIISEDTDFDVLKKIEFPRVKVLKINDFKILLNQ